MQFFRLGKARHLCIRGRSGVFFFLVALVACTLLGWMSSSRVVLSRSCEPAVCIAYVRIHRVFVRVLTCMFHKFLFPLFPTAVIVSRVWRCVPPRRCRRCDELVSTRWRRGWKGSLVRCHPLVFTSMENPVLCHPSKYPGIEGSPTCGGETNSWRSPTVSNPTTAKPKKKQNGTWEMGDGRAIHEDGTTKERWKRRRDGIDDACHEESETEEESIRYVADVVLMLRACMHAQKRHVDHPSNRTMPNASWYGHNLPTAYKRPRMGMAAPNKTTRTCHSRRAHPPIVGESCNARERRSLCLW